MQHKMDLQQKAYVQSKSIIRALMNFTQALGETIFVHNMLLQTPSPPSPPPSLEFQGWNCWTPHIEDCIGDTN